VLLQSGSVSIDYLVVGSGDPVTVFAHGLGGSIVDTRPLASGVAGTKVFFHFRGHGDTTAPQTPWTYADLAHDLLAVADHVGATRALGVSMGAGALLRILTADPQRFQRAVFFLPAVIDWLPADAPFAKVDRLADLVERGDVDGLTAALLADQPDGVRELPQALDYVRGRAVALAGTPVAHALRTISRALPIEDRGRLAAVTTPALVIGQRGDPVHLSSIAEELGAALPNATVRIFDESGAIWLARRELREVITGFLNEGSAR
jgi:pimeloyl-ACP methyl ester carboxylesterase